MKAIVIGGTGATGKELVQQLVDNASFTEVVALVRKPFFEHSSKLREVVVDFENLEMFQDHIQGDVAFSCLGTTRKDAGSKAAQWRIDHDYPLKFAAIVRRQGAQTFVLLSAAGAHHRSWIFYSKLKGVLEKNIHELGFHQYLVLRPGAIDRPETTRSGEKWMVQMIKKINQIGLLRTYAPISVKPLAHAMIAAYFKSPAGYRILDLKEINRLSGG